MLPSTNTDIFVLPAGESGQLPQDPQAFSYALKHYINWNGEHVASVVVNWSCAMFCWEALRHNILWLLHFSLQHVVQEYWVFSQFHIFIFKLYFQFQWKAHSSTPTSPPLPVGRFNDDVNQNCIITSNWHCVGLHYNSAQWQYEHIEAHILYVYMVYVWWYSWWCVYQ